MMVLVGKRSGDLHAGGSHGGPIIRRPRRRAPGLLEIAQADRQQIVVVPDEVFEQVPTPLIDTSGSRLGRFSYVVRQRLPARIPGIANRTVDGRMQAVRELREDGVPILPVT